MHGAYRAPSASMPPARVCCPLTHGRVDVQQGPRESVNFSLLKAGPDRRHHGAAGVGVGVFSWFFMDDVAP